MASLAGTYKGTKVSSNTGYSAGNMFGITSGPGINIATKETHFRHVTALAFHSTFQNLCHHSKIPMNNTSGLQAFLYHHMHVSPYTHER